MTLNEIVHSIADSVGQPMNRMLIERLKFTVKYYRAEFIRQDITKNGLNASYLQTINMDLKLVDESDYCGIDTGCKVLRTINKVPKPVRTKYNVPFNYVGYVAFKGSFSYRRGQENIFTKFNKFTACSLGYDYKNDYIYVFNNTKLKKLLIQQPFENPEDINSFCVDGTDNACYSDDNQFPLPADMIRGIIQGIKTNELRILGKDDNEVEIKEH